MTEEQTRAVTKERLAAWAEKLAAENATPAVLVGIGHGPHSGTISVCTVEDLTDEQIVGFLVYAARHLSGE